VEDVVYLGESTRVHCAAPGAGRLLAHADSRVAGSLRQGDPVKLTFDAGDAIVIPDDAG
jgi:hypothetical protein